MSIKNVMLAFLFAVLAGTVLAGCDAVPAADDSGTRESSERVTVSAGPHEEKPGDELPEPPGSTLSHGGETLTAGLGSYCWRFVCTDTFAVPVSEEVLTVPAGSVLKFVYGGDKLDSVSVSAQRIGPKDRLRRMAGSTFLVAEKEGKAYEKRVRLKPQLSENRARVKAKLPAGDYALEAFARFPGGDAFYGFRVVVE